MSERFAAVEVGDETVCRTCLTWEETDTARRGFTDTLSNDTVESGDYFCSRCNNQITSYNA